MLEAVIFATNHQMIFVPKRPKPVETKNRDKGTNSWKTGHLLMGDRLLRIQQGLNSRQSINSVAKKEGISEGLYGMR
jgi:hypothetical protein